MEPALVAWLLLGCSNAESGGLGPAGAAPDGGGEVAPLQAQQVEVTSSGDAWLDAVAALEGTVAPEAMQELSDRARARAVARTRDHDDVRAAQYAVAALVATEGGSAATRAAFDRFEQAERAAVAEETSLALAIVTAAGAEGTDRLRKSGALDETILSPAALDVRALGRGAMQLPIDDSTASDAVVLHLLKIRYGLAAEAVNIDGALAALERAVADVDGGDPNAVAAVAAASDNLTERSIRFQRTKYQHAVELRNLLGIRAWLDLLEQWSLVEFLGCLGCKHADESASPTLADQLLGFQGRGSSDSPQVGAATRANAAAGGSGQPSAPGAQINQGGQRPIGGGSWAGMPQ